MTTNAQLYLNAHCLRAHVRLALVVAQLGRVVGPLARM